MPNKKRSGQITTPAPQGLKGLWEAECGRLKNTCKVRFRGRLMFPGNLQLGLIAEFLAVEDPSEREAIARAALQELLKYPQGEPSVEPGAQHTPAVGLAHDLTGKTNGHSVDNPANNVARPKRRKRLRSE